MINLDELKSNAKDIISSKKEERSKKKEERIDQKMDKVSDREVRRSNKEDSKTIRYDSAVKKSYNTAIGKSSEDADIEPAMNQLDDESKSYAKGLLEIEKAFQPKQEVNELSKKDREDAMALEKKKKRLKWLDIVSAGVQPLTSEGYDVSRLPSNIAKAKQEEIYSKYRDTAQKNQAAQKAYRDKQQAIIVETYKNAYKNAKTPEDKEMAKIKLDQEKAKLAKLRGDANKAAKPDKPDKSKTPYTDAMQLSPKEQFDAYKAVFPEAKNQPTAAQYNEFFKAQLAKSGNIDPETGQFVFNEGESAEAMAESIRLAEIDKRIERLKTQIADEESKAHWGSTKGARDAGLREKIAEYQAEIEELEKQRGGSLEDATSNTDPNLQLSEDEIASILNEDTSTVKADTSTVKESVKKESGSDKELMSKYLP